MKLAVVQMAMATDAHENLARAGELVAEAADSGANLVLLPELFDGPYFPQSRDDASDRAHAVGDSPTVRAMRTLARARSVHLPISFFERDANRFFNSLAMIDNGGEILGVYRKSHIPDGPGYEEKSHFSPGDTGFRTWETTIGRIGVGICWDQWFPECARAMTLSGADVLLYPTAIGSEPRKPRLDTRDTWRRVMIGHAAANTTPVAAANRVGDEGALSFYGSSFITDQWGGVTAELDRTASGVALSEIDVAQVRRDRNWFGALRDRRPDLYGRLTEPVDLENPVDRADRGED